MSRRIWILLSIFILPGLGVLASPMGRTSAARAGDGDPGPLRVGTREAPPFVISGPDGRLGGLAIDLWEETASRLGVAYEYETGEIDGLLAGVASGSLDVVAAPLTITAGREEWVDFTHAFYTTGLGIAVPVSAGGGWATVAPRALSSGLLQAVLALVILLLGIGLLIWLVERRQNPEQFGGSPWHGIGSGFWWSAVTMTTVGYGDKAPRSFLGRLVGIVWMFAAIIMISSFTAAITSSLTVSNLGGRVASPDDLPSVRVGVISASTSQEEMLRRGIRPVEFKSFEEGLRALADGRVDAMVHDAPVLRHLIRERHQGRLRVLPVTFEPQQYGFALPEGSPMREPINRILLQITAGEEWRRQVDRMLGP